MKTKINNDNEHTKKMIIPSIENIQRDLMMAITS